MPFITENFFQLSGFLLIGIVLIQACLLLYVDIKRTFNQRQQNLLEHTFWKQQIDTVMQQQAEKKASLHAWDGWRKFVVKEKIEETADTYSFYLRPHDKKTLPYFFPGQFLTFRIRIKGHEHPVIRCYSISDQARKKYYRISVKRILANNPTDQPGLVSNYFHDHIQKGDILDVKAPAGKFYLQKKRSQPVVLIAGGIGITPLMSMLNSIVTANNQRETWVFYGVRHFADCIMHAHLENIAKEYDNVHLHICFSHLAVENLPKQSYYHNGRVSIDLLKQCLPSSNYAFYICGPSSMMQSMVSGLKDWSVADKYIHYEAFGQASVKQTLPLEQEHESIDVTFSRSGKTVTWQKNAGSLLELGEQHGIQIPFTCRAGNCGECSTAIRSGDIKYLHEPGETMDQGICRVCIAIPQTPLVLDA